MVRKIDYQFTAIPTQLFLCMDNNCRSTLFSLIQLSTFYESKNGDAFNGWFFRTNALLEEETNLSKNVLNGALDALYQAGIIDVIPQDKGKGKTQGARKYKINYGSFLKYQDIPIEECSCSNSDIGVVTANYKKGAPSFQRQPQLEMKPKCGQSDNNIESLDNTEKEDIVTIENKNNTDIIINNDIEVISNSISTNNSSSYNFKPPIDTTGTGAEQRPETKPQSQALLDKPNKEREEPQHRTMQKQEEKPRQGGSNGSKGSDFLRSITLEDEDEGVPPCPLDERYMNYVCRLQDILRYDAEPDYTEMTDADIMAAVKDTIDDAIECERQEGTSRRYRDLINRAKKMYQHLNGCDEYNARRGITRLYREREKELQ